MNEHQGENQTPRDPAEIYAEDTSLDTPHVEPPESLATGQARRSAADPAGSQQPVEDFARTRQPAESKPDPRNLRPKTGPIVWGVLVLAFCVYTASQTVAPGSVNGTTFVIAATITLGVLLLAIGAAVIIRSSRAQRR